MAKVSNRDTVVMPIAGQGTRMKGLAFFPKHLLPYKDKAVVSHIIEQFPARTKFHLIVRPEDRLTRDYVKLAHPDLDVQFDESKNPEAGNVLTELHSWAEGFNPQGSSLWVVMGDAIWTMPRPHQRHAARWLGVKDVPIDLQYDYTMVRNYEGVLHLSERKPLKYGHAWTGVSFFSSARGFVNALNSVAETGSLTWSRLFQLVYTSQTLELVDLDWTDLGTYEKYVTAAGSPDWHPVDRTTYQLHHAVVKLHPTAETAANHTKVSNSLKCGIKTEVLGHFTSTSRLDAPSMYGTISVQSLDTLLDWTLPELWGSVSTESCAGYSAWFQDKVLQRLANYFDKPDAFYRDTVNGVCLTGTAYERVFAALKTVARTRTKCATRLHGDLTLSNTLLTEEGKLIFVDLNTNLPKDTGLPIVYDLSKLWLSTHFDIEQFRKGNFKVSDIPQGLTVSLPTSTGLRQMEDHFLRRVSDFGVSSRDIQLYGALHLVCMAGYHSGQYANALYAYSQYLLQNLLPKDFNK